MPTSSSLQYDRLSPDISRKPIRLLELLPSSTSAAIKCRLIYAFLTENPLYEALSYCWGDLSNPVTIQCDTSTISVTQNLYSALVRLQKKQEIRTLWVDAICINQNDDLERSHQVRQMKDIYQTASQTLVWLGPGNEQTRKGFELVPYLLDAHLAPNENQPFVYGPLLERRLTHPKFGALQNRRDLYPAFRQLDRLPYFSRIWIIQELVVSKNNTQILCGSDVISQNMFIFAFGTFNRLSLGERAVRRPWGSFLEIMQTSAKFSQKEFHSLLFLLESYREMKSTDPRDKVFGILGIADPKDVASLGIEVNYQQDTTTLYIHLAKAFIQRDKNFNIFQCLGVASNRKELPTWVPDWAIENEIPLPFGYYRKPNFCEAGGRMSISVTFGPNGKELVTDGMIIDTISSIGVVVGPEGRGKIYQDWEAVAGKVHSEKYVSGGSMIDAFITTVLAGYPQGTFAIVKRQFLSVYKKAKTEFPAAFSQSSGIIHKEALRQDLWGKDGDVSTTQDNEMEQLFKCMGWTVGRRFCVTNQGYFALVPGQANQQDHIALLRGGRYPVVLRANKSAWDIIGECYVHGIMHGELYQDVGSRKLTLI
ncbi:hypothetical protein V500_06634 [Pseudogymnoascus sp. VKM F-4518 (FW-2643)]|nr:hypothetical protein V500_06634 [Pseudogymnoascus sp. VKM F-4518 (FW-2643)]